MPLHSLGVMWAPLFSATRHGLKVLLLELLLLELLLLELLLLELLLLVQVLLLLLPRPVSCVTRHWEAMRYLSHCARTPRMYSARDVCWVSRARPLCAKCASRR